MAGGARRKPFSGKAKKEQLQAKRANKNTRARRQGSDEDKAKEQFDDDKEQLAAVLPPSPVRATGSGTRGDLRSVFEVESQESILQRKKDATRPLTYASNRGDSQSIYELYAVHQPCNQPPIFQKPKWTRKMTVDQLNQVETNAYNDWVSQLKEYQRQQQQEQQSHGKPAALAINLYERNLHVWQELWRVLERSDIIVHLADARCPLLHLSDRLLAYVRESLSQKRCVIVLTKADLVTNDRLDHWLTYLRDRFSGVAVMVYRRDNADGSNAELMHHVAQLSGTIDPECSSAFTEPDTLTLGFVGEPNVGKSSLLNSLFKRKLVSVSSTPGHTKHLQTHLFEPTQVQLLKNAMAQCSCPNQTQIARVVVCDCPGVVFPRLNVPVALQILFGSFPIAQTREPFSAIRFICENCLPSLDAVYKLLPVDEDDGEWSPYTLCEAYAQQRGFHVKGGKLDVNRAANQLLRDALNGRKVVLSFPPPSLAL